jgi:hypothetical protein
MLFTPGDSPDIAYCNLRDAPHCTEWKAFCEQLWERYQPYADRHFLDEIRVQFHQRFWEMYLTVTFVDRGFEIHRPPRGAGPEFGVDIAGKRYWFDAVAPNAGDGPDAVREPEPGAREARRVPQEQIILRLMSAVAAKREKWRQDLERGRVSKDDGFIVAVNDRKVYFWAGLGAEMPYIAKGLYGFGHLAVAFDTRTLDITEVRHEHRPHITKVTGASVSSQPFSAQEYTEVSAVLYSSVDAANHPGVLGGDFRIFHNSGPNVPLPLGALRFHAEFWVGDDHLNSTEWRAGSKDDEKTS